MAITPKTELRAVNQILRNMGETPVNSLTGNIALEAAQAYETLTEVSEEVQTKGWFFNTEIHRFVPDTRQQIRVPPNTLDISAYGESYHMQITLRGRNLFNKAPFKNTTRFEGPVTAQVIVGLPFEELPNSARRYITLRAAREMQIREAGDDMSLQADQADEVQALADLHAEQLANEPLTIRWNPSVVPAISRLPYG